MCILAKRLERGRFNWPRGSDAARLGLAPEALTMPLAGIDLRHGMRRAWYEAPEPRAGHDIKGTLKIIILKFGR